MIYIHPMASPTTSCPSPHYCKLIYEMPGGSKRRASRYWKMCAILRAQKTWLWEVSLSSYKWSSSIPTLQNPNLSIEDGLNLIFKANDKYAAEWQSKAACAIPKSDFWDQNLWFLDRIFSQPIQKWENNLFFRFWLCFTRDLVFWSSYLEFSDIPIWSVGARNFCSACLETFRKWWENILFQLSMLGSQHFWEFWFTHLGFDQKEPRNLLFPSRIFPSDAKK